MAQKIYTKLEIDKINAQHTATIGTVYTDELGNSYIGTTNNNLKLLQAATVTPIDAIDGISSTSVQGAIIELNDRVTAIEINYVTEEELTSAKQEIRCFS